MRLCFLLLCALAFVVVAVGAERTDNGGAGAKTAPDLDLNGVWRGFVVKGKGEQPDRGSVHLELTIKGNSISAKRLDGEGGSLGNGTYMIAVGRFYMIDATEARSRGKGRVPGYLQIRPRPDEMVYRHAGQPTSHELRDQRPAVSAGPQATQIVASRRAQWRPPCDSPR